MKETFEDYLMEQYIEEESPLKEQIPDGFNDWLVNLDVDYLIEYGQKYADKQKSKIKRKIKKMKLGKDFILSPEPDIKERIEIHNQVLDDVLKRIK